MSETRVEYRLTFESVNAHWAATFEGTGGKWVHLWDEGGVWDTLPWEPPTVRIAGDGSDIHGQYHQLKRWEESHEQPIRNVKLERRELVVDDEGWEPAHV